ncbi:MAG: family efflux transporter, subunit [Panacagrimonas sp.]|jgi:HlyD family secretion protein|nr:efflux RND transporter periplasmic adaptor subunit [Panacagrimonas sp.]MCC2657882.1 family efflux transporter, subunit [Panacagrimonas sp.]
MNFLRSLLRPGVLVFVVLAAVAVAAWAAWNRNGDRESPYLTEEVSRGEIVETVSANGTLNPVVLVSIGTQVSGTAIKVHADFNDNVTEGQVLVELDPAAYEARVRQGRASLESAQASLELARANEARSRDLFEKGYVAKQEVDQTRQALKSATAQVEQARAAMADAEVDLRNSVIKSPVSGTVVARTVEEGQTVAASFQTPELFKIAGDLKKMLIHTTFAEADIGRIQPGQGTRFTVDAFPDRSFQGKVRQVRMNPTTTQNVVTYDVVIDVDNEDLSLLPGMTAYVSVELSRVENVLRVPNSALRYTPTDAEGITKAAANGGQQPRRERAAGSGNGNRGKSGGGRRGDKGAGERTVYVLRGKQIQAVMVKPSHTDGRFTAIESDELREGDVVVVGDRVASRNNAQQPQMRMRMF